MDAALIAGLVTIIAALLKWYLGRDKTYESLQLGRQDIQSGNTGAVSQRVDRVLADQSGTAGNPAGVESAEDIERRLRAVCGVSTDERSDDQTVGSR